MSKRIHSALAVSAITVLLNTCGGTKDDNHASSSGSNGNNGIQSPPVLPPAGTGVTVDAAAAWREYLSTARRWDITGSQGGSNFTLSLVLTPSGQASFPPSGQVAQTSIESLRLSFAGVASTNTDSTLFHNNDSLIGIVGGSGANATCAVARSPFGGLPANGAPGASGTLVSLDTLDACTSTARRIGSATLNWSIEQDLAVTLFCLTTVRADANGANIGSQTACVQSNAQGELGSSAHLTLQRADGTIITGKNY